MDEAETRRRLELETTERLAQRVVTIQAALAELFIDEWERRARAQVQRDAADLADEVGVKDGLVPAGQRSRKPADRREADSEFGVP